MRRAARRASLRLYARTNTSANPNAAANSGADVRANGHSGRDTHAPAHADALANVRAAAHGYTTHGSDAHEPRSGPNTDTRPNLHPTGPEPYGAPLGLHADAFGRVRGLPHHLHLLAAGASVPGHRLAAPAHAPVDNAGHDDDSEATVILTALPDVSTPCLTSTPCTCPVYGPGGEYGPVQDTSGWHCQLALYDPPVTIMPTALVPSLSSWALAALLVALAITGAWRLR